MKSVMSSKVLKLDSHHYSKFGLLRFILIFVFMGLCSSCSFLDHPADNMVELGKTIWGSSTRALEQARDKALTKTYDKPYWDCVRSTIAVVGKRKWVIFKKDEVNGYLVIMGVKGCVNSTEIGIFFDEISDTQTRIEVASLSTNAKRKVARALFHGLDIAFGYVPPDPPEAINDTDASKKDQNQPVFPLPDTL